MKEKKVIAIVGAGGKTTLLHRMAERYRKEGKKVLITTTTHMMAERGCELSCELPVLKERLHKEGILMAGKICRENEAKICALPEELLQQMAEEADVTLVEADGSKHLPLKYPSEAEPVIPKQTTDIIIVMGLHGIGKRADEVIHRYKLAEEAFGISPDDIVSRELVQRLAEEGYQKKLAGKHPDAVIRILYSYFEGEQLFFTENTR